MPALTDRILRVNAVADKLSVTTETLRQWEKKGALPKRIKLGERAAGWRESDIDNFINTRAEASAAA